MRFLPSRHDYAGVRHTWRADLLAGVTVGVVALPLALAFGISSGMGAAAGLATAIVAGIVAAVFGGSNLQVSGPTGAMTVVLVPVIAEHGAGVVPVLTIVAGLLLIVAALAGLGRYVHFIPWPVIEGFTIGIAAVIFLQQLPAALGVSKPSGDHTLFVAVRTITAWGGQVGATQIILAIAVVTMLAMARWRRTLPASLVAVAATTMLVRFTDLEVATIGDIPSSITFTGFPGLSLSDIPSLLSTALAIAALAGIESLLSAKVADALADDQRTEPDRELFGQGLANVAVSFFGGMPATGAIARTAVNVRAGGETRLAAIAHGVVLFAVVVSLAPVVATIPLAALSGVLMVTAVRMVDLGSVRELLRSTRGDALVLVATAAATVFFDLVVAVEVGIVLAAALALRSVALTTSFQREMPDAVDIDIDTEHRLFHEHIVTYRLDGALFFGAAQRFLMELTDVADVRVVILRLGQVQVLDATGAQALGDLVTHLQGRKIDVLLCSIRPRHLELMRTVGVLDALEHEHHVFPSIEEALVYARERVGSNDSYLDPKQGHRADGRSGLNGPVDRSS